VQGRLSLISGLQRGLCLYWAARYAESLELSERLRDDAKLGGQIVEEAIALRYAADALSGLARNGEAVESAMRAFELAAQAGHVREQAIALSSAAYCLGELSRTPKPSKAQNAPPNSPSGQPICACRLTPRASPASASASSDVLRTRVNAPAARWIWSSERQIGLESQFPLGCSPNASASCTNPSPQ